MINIKKQNASRCKIDRNCETSKYKKKRISFLSSARTKKKKKKKWTKACIWGTEHMYTHFYIWFWTKSARNRLTRLSMISDVSSRISRSVFFFFYTPRLINATDRDIRGVSDERGEKTFSKVESSHDFELYIILLYLPAKFPRDLDRFVIPVSVLPDDRIRVHVRSREWSRKLRENDTLSFSLVELSSPLLRSLLSFDLSRVYSVHGNEFCEMKNDQARWSCIYFFLFLSFFCRSSFIEVVSLDTC